MKFPYLIILGVTLLLCKKTHSQVYSIVKGNAVDAQTKEKIAFAKVKLVSLTDTSIYKTQANSEGQFSIPSIKEIGPFMVVVDAFTYSTFVKKFEINKSIVVLKDLRLIKKSSLLKSVKIKNKRKPFSVKGDTIVYDAKYFKMNADMDALYLLNKMPGINTKDQLTVDGDSVSQIQINGIVSYNENYRELLSTIPANIIKKVLLFDDTETSANNQMSNRTTKVINLITLKDHYSTPKGSLYAGYGTKNLFVVGGNMRTQNKSGLISINGKINKGPIKTGSYYEPESQFTSNGIPTTGNLNFYLRKKIDKKNTINISNSSYTNNNIVESRVKEYFMNDTLPNEFEQNSRNKSEGISNRLSLTLIHSYSPNKKLTINGGFYFFQSKSNQSSEIVNLNSTENFYRDNLFNSSSRTQFFKNKIAYQNTYKNSDKLNISFNSSIRNKYIDIGSSGSLVTSNANTQNNFSSVEQPINYKLAPNIDYSTTLFKKLKTKFFFNNNSSINSNSLQRDNIVNNSAILDTNLSFNSQYGTIINSLGFLTHYPINKKTTMVIGLESLNGIVYGNINSNTDNVNKNYLKFNPKVEINYAKNNLQKLQLTIEKKTEFPEFNQLNPILFQSNNYDYYQGNIGLRPSDRYSSRFSYTSRNQEKGSYFATRISGIYIKNPIIESFFLTQKDSSLYNGFSINPWSRVTYYDNSKNYKYLYSVIRYDLPAKFIKSILKLRANAEYLNSLNFLNFKEINLEEIKLGFGISLVTNFSKKIELNLYSSSEYSISNQIFNNKLYSIVNNGLLSVVLNKKLILKTEFNHNSLIGLSSNNGNTNFFLLNTALTTKAFKDKMSAEFRIHDILKSYTNYSIVRSPSYSRETYRNNLGRYLGIIIKWKL